MKIIYNNIIPLKGFSAINIFGILFARKGREITETTIRHEQIHSKQMGEVWFLSVILWGLLCLFGLLGFWWVLLTPFSFYLLYVSEWILRVILPPYNSAYKDISFEVEAKDNASDSSYLCSRKSFAWLRKRK